MSQINYSLIFKQEVQNLSEFHALALEISKILTTRCVVALSGSLGAGKTEFVKTVAEARGFHDVASPTFAIHHRYQNAGTSLDHLDLYRLENEDELETTGFWDFFSSDEGVIFIEWPERMDLSHIPYDWDLFHLEIVKTSETDRRLVFSKRN